MRLSQLATKQRIDVKEGKKYGQLEQCEACLFHSIPFGQDQAIQKPTSLIADFSKIKETVEHAILHKTQIQPLIIQFFK